MPLSQGHPWSNLKRSLGSFRPIRAQCPMRVVILLHLCIVMAACSLEEPSHMFASRSLSTHKRPHRLALRYRLTEQGEDITYARFLALLAESESFRDHFIDLLEACPYEAFFWECVPVDADTVNDEVFEFVLVESKALTNFDAADVQSFAGHFAVQSAKPVAVFENLGRDAMLVAPQPIAAHNNLYIHFKSFINGAHHEQKHQLLIAISAAMQLRLRERPREKVWLSTSGLGVPYLHVRLDSFPKYYSYAPYK